MRNYLPIVKRNEERFIEFVEACDNKVISISYDEETRCANVFIIPNAHKYSSTYLNKMAQTAKKFPLFYGTSVCVISVNLFSQKIELQDCFVNRTVEWTQGMTELQKRLGQCLNALASNKDNDKTSTNKFVKNEYDNNYRDDIE